MTTQYINPDTTVVAVRQACSAAFSGVAPVATLAGPVIVDCEPVVFSQGVYQYAYPVDPTVLTLSAGGLFDLGDKYTYAILAVRAHCGAASTLTLTVEERDGSLPTEILTAVSAAGVEHKFTHHNGLAVLPSQVVHIVTTDAGTVDLYVARFLYT